MGDKNGRVMKELTYTIPNNLSLLHDELTAGIAELRPVRDEDTGSLLPTMGVQGDGNKVYLTVPNNVDETAIAAIVRAHDADKRRPDPLAAARLSTTRKLSALGLTSAEIAVIIRD
jgi:hypothetical protein